MPALGHLELCQNLRFLWALALAFDTSSLLQTDRQTDNGTEKEPFTESHLILSNCEIARILILQFFSFYSFGCCFGTSPYALLPSLKLAR